MLDDRPVESEASFVCPSRAVGDVLQVHRLGALLRIEDQQVRLTDTYFDTPDLKLHHRGSALRIREDALGGRFATFKGPPMVELNRETSTQHRLEIESTIGPLDPHLDRSRPIGLYRPIPAFDAARERFGDIIIEPIARLVNNRRIMTFRSTLGEQVELAIDRVAGVRLGDYRPTEFLEVELELIDGDLTTFESLVADLRSQAPALRAETRSKLTKLFESD